MARKTRTKTTRASGGVKLGENNYGKSRVRMVKVSRRGRVHSVREFDVDIRLRGDFGSIHDGDNALCLPTDTMKNTVYVLGKDHAIESIEEFAIDLARHFVSRNRQVTFATVRIDEKRWDRVSVRGKSHAHAFIKGSDERQIAHASVWPKGRSADTSVCGALGDLMLMKTTDSAFSGFPRDEYTTLQETRDRIFATSVEAFWLYRASERNFNACRDAIRRALIDTFADHKSESVQHTLYAMGAAALKACRSIDEIRLSLPNKHCLLVNLAPFGMTNKNEVFVPTDEPHGLIEATIERR